MAVPKAAMNEHCFLFCREYQVRAARQALLMHRVTITEAMECSADVHLRLGILGTNRSHYAAATLSCIEYTRYHSAATATLLLLASARIALTDFATAAAKRAGTAFPI